MIDIPVDPKLIDASFAFDGMLDEGFSESDLCAAGATNFPDKLRIRRSDWDEFIAEQARYKSSPEDFSARQTHQGSSHECTCHAGVQSFEIAYNRQFGGLKYCFYGSPVALYSLVTGGRQWGGANVNEVLRVLMSRGMLPEHDGPEWLGGKGGQAKRFKHTVHQTSGRSEEHWPTKGWVRESQFPDGWEATAKHFRVLEAWYIPDAEAHASALLRGYCVVNGRQGHSIPHIKLVKSGGRYLSRYRDSYFRDLFDSEGLWGGGYAIATVTSPDDPLKPAAEQMREVTE